MHIHWTSKKWKSLQHQNRRMQLKTTSTNSIELRFMLFFQLMISVIPRALCRVSLISFECRSALIYEIKNSFIKSCAKFDLSLHDSPDLSSWSWPFPFYNTSYLINFISCYRNLYSLWIWWIWRAPRLGYTSEYLFHDWAFNRRGRF